jgi:polysaccharide biosynthesis/export protein
MIRVLKMIVVGLLGIALNSQAQGLTDYELGGGDSIKLSVFLSPELTTEVRLSETGQVSLPMLGQIGLAGLTVLQAEEFIATKLKEGNFIQKAQVSISVSAYRAQQITILGNVNRPGRFPLEAKGLRLTDMLAMAGGITPTGGDNITLTRRSSKGEVTSQDIDVASIYLNNEQRQNIVLQGGDSIYVHKQPQYFIYGQIGRPGNYPLDRGLTVSQAIAKGGSYTLRSRESGVRLMRRDANGKMNESIPKMDDPVRPDDQILVKESLF